jgi:ubiquinone/menaquinone biosynthesis C-methylase UbiE
MLDAAAGTGDISLRVMRSLSSAKDRNVIVSDISRPMLVIAQRRAGNHAQMMTFRAVRGKEIAVLRGPLFAWRRPKFHFVRSIELISRI